MTKPTFPEYIQSVQEVTTKSGRVLESVSESAGRAIIESLTHGGKVICFGNGGSADQASHLAGELVGRFRANRKSLPAISLVSDAATITCIANDFGYSEVFARQMEAFAQPGDIAIGLTTSGKSENVVKAFAVASERRAATIALTGAGGLIGGKADYLVAVPSTDTAHIQEVHLMVLHSICIAIEDAFPEAGKKS